MKHAFVPPADLEPLTRHPKAAAPGRHIALHHSTCFGCGDDVPLGLHLKVMAGEGLTVDAQMPVQDWMQGGPGVIHGGVLSAAFDEVMGTSPLLVGAPVVTVHLEVDFAKPIPLGSDLQFHARILGSERRKIYIDAIAHLGDPNAPVAGAHSVFVVIDVEKHFAEHFDKRVVL
ncbi:PaaI family thioesterase [Gordonia liuliyuniae]|uniref:Acyl-coenzyme A thioesterase THEM4 n=1 Tax=Gordonia liuliyuniae TaxID=2911517 RepID=A0ABS9IVV1_9ACTN|nr:PaaI family thioesterase [Gordonia liuliyuniae]MCF8589615.1 PaaI family thioesterase [Gordonia liuliyuniae]